MPFFQEPPTTPQEIEHSRPLDLPPDEVVKLEEEEWYERAYRGDDTPQLTVPVLIGWTFFLAALGVVLAIPMKRNLINQEKLKFPSGTAAAVLLQSLYTEGSEALIKARALLVAGLVSGFLPLLKDLEI